MKLLRFIWHLPRNMAIGVVRFYQLFFSPDHSFWSKELKPFGFCKYHPSCSQYMRMALKEKGFVRGILKGIGRILRCNPWSKGGVDLP